MTWLEAVDRPSTAACILIDLYKCRHKGTRGKMVPRWHKIRSGAGPDDVSSACIIYRVSHDPMGRLAENRIAVSTAGQIVSRNRVTGTYWSAVR